MTNEANAVTATEDCEVFITRVLKAPRELVFKAWTRPEHLSQWWLPDGFTNTGGVMDLRVGGQFRLDMQGPDGGSYPCEGVYEEIVVPERITWTGMRDDRHPCGSGLPPHGRVTVSFVEQGTDTRLTIRARFHSREMCEAARQHGFSTSWEAGLDKLATLLATHDVLQNTPS